MRYLNILWVGLAVAILLIGQHLISTSGKWRERSWIPHWLDRNHELLSEVAYYLQKGSAKMGHYPSNDEALSSIAATLTYKPGVAGKGLSRFARPAGSSVLSIWGEPLIYENRRAVPAVRFSSSAVDADEERRYSVEVDKGIYVWSLGSKRAKEHYRNLGLQMESARLALRVASSACIALFLLSIVRLARKRGLPLAGLLAVGGIGTGIITVALVALWIHSSQAHRLCADPAYWLSATPELAADYTKLVTENHKHGVISDKAYQTMLNNLGRQPGD